MSWVEQLLAAVKALFTKAYASDLKSGHPVKLNTAQWDPTFDALVSRLDTGSTQRRQSDALDSEGPPELTPPSSSASAADDAEEPPPPLPGAQFKKPARREEVLEVEDTSTDATPVPTPDTSRPATPARAASHLLTAKGGPGGKGSRRARKAQQNFGSSAPASSGDESSTGRNAKGGKTGAAKGKRRWDAHGMAIEGDDDGVLDYSAPATPAPDSEERELDVGDVDAGQMGTRSGEQGHFLLKDLDDEVDAILASSKQSTKPTASISTDTDAASTGLLGSATSRLTGLFRNVVGGKTLSKSCLLYTSPSPRDGLLSRMPSSA